MAYNTMSHVGLEDDFATPDQLTKMSTSWHYGWEWKGPEPEGTVLHAANGKPLVSSRCVCHRAPCGLITVPEKECYTHKDSEVGRAKQLHKASECPAT